MCSIEKKPTQYLDTLLIYAVFGTIVGARLGHCLFYEADYYLKHPVEILFVWKGGLASHGGGLGVLFAIWLFTKKYKVFSFFWIVDRASILVAFTGGLIRIGNLINSEIVGKPSSVPWAFIFDIRDQIPRHPTQIYESLSYFLISFIGYRLYKKYNSNPPPNITVWFYYFCHIYF